MTLAKQGGLLIGMCFAAGALLYVAGESALHAASNHSDEYTRATQPPAVALAIAGPEELLLSADAPHCPGVDVKGERMDVPDAPLRAIRSDHGLLVISAHYNNLAYASSDLVRIDRRNCVSMLPSALDADPSRFTDHEWLVSMYVQKGRIFALVHNEYWGGLYNSQCRDRLGRRNPWDAICLYGNLTGAVSSDAGLSFQRTSVVAAYPYAFSPEMNRNGVRDPSNLFHNPDDGYVYFMAWIDPQEDQQGGECLFRSKDPLSEPWFAWDGRNFGALMGSPFGHQQARCEPVSGLWISTVVHVASAKTFVAIAYDERVKPGGVFYRTSKDLIHWSKPSLILEAHDAKHLRSGDDSRPLTYPSLIDPASSSPNFDTAGPRPYLYFNRWRVKNGKPQGRERDIMRVPLTLKTP